ncbi:MAG: DUF302 domain-containing protein, partial [Campylobacterota bacterium]|nr:DUF302 domain-containing protein [Campylobacterota bacterium]
TPKVKTVQKTELREDIRILTVENTQGKITTKSIEKAFKANGFSIVGNNDMNKAFEGRFGKDFPNAGKDFNMYRLMFVNNPKITSKLLKDYPEVGLLSPLSTSVYSKDGKSISISSLSLTGMSRISGVPETNIDLIALFDSMTNALKEALPNGKYQKLSYKKIRPDGELITRFAFVLKNKGDIEEAKEDYQESMEGEIESSGFIVAGFYPVQEDLVENGVKDYEFYDTYSICKLEVIFPVHKVHPEVGAFAPCTMYMYKKKGEKYTRMGYPSVYNWIMSTNIYDDESITPLIDAQNLLETKIDSTME